MNTDKAITTKSAPLAALITHTETSTDPALLATLRQRLTLPDLVNKKQAAEYLGIAVRTLDDWRAAKAIPYIAHGGYIRFRRRDLDDFLDAHTIQPRSAPAYRPRRRRRLPKGTAAEQPST